MNTISSFESINNVYYHFWSPILGMLVSNSCLLNSEILIKHVCAIFFAISDVTFTVSLENISRKFHLSFFNYVHFDYISIKWIMINIVFYKYGYNFEML